MIRRYLFVLMLGVLTVAGLGGGAPVSAGVRAQFPPPFPLPAPLYLLTEEHQLVRLDPERGSVAPISDLNVPLADFDIAPDGDWVVYRTQYEGRVVVSNLRDGRGQMLALSGETPPSSGPRQTIAWSPKGDAIAYIVAGEGVTIRSLAASGSAEVRVRGAWVELYWADEATVMASDEAGNVTRMAYEDGRVTLMAAPDAPSRPQPAFPAYLSAQGVVYDGVPIPNTAGALAFDWGPPPLPSVQGLRLPADLFFLADGALWRVPQDGRAAYALVRDPQRQVWAYAPSPDGTQLAYIADVPREGSAVYILDVADGTEHALGATLSTPFHDERAGPAWQPDGDLIAYADGAGLWLASHDGSAPPTLLFANQGTGDNPAPNTVRRYHTPRWSPNGTHLLVTVDLWESREWLIYDMARDTSHTLRLPAMTARWADDSHLLAWSWSWSVYFDAPALYLVTLDAPESEQLTPLLTEQAIYDVRYTTRNGTHMLTSPLILSGPVYAQVQYTPTLGGSLESLPLGSFVDAGWGAKTARLSPPATDGMPVLAVLQHPTQHAGSDIVSGDLAVFTAEQSVQIVGGFVQGQVHMLCWGS